MRIVILLVTMAILVTGCDKPRKEPGKKLVLIPAALRKGPVEEAKAMLSTNPAAATMVDSTGSTPLHFAVVNGNMELVELLISNGGDVGARNVLGQSMLHRSVNSTNTAITQLLIDEGLNINGRDNFSRTPLMMAVIAGHPSVVKLMLENKADPRIRNNSGMNSFHQGADCNVELFKVLLDTKPEIEGPDAVGNTMLHHAAFGGKLANAKLLVEANANIVATNKFGQTPLQVVEGVTGEERRAGHDRVEDYLRELMGLPRKERPAKSKGTKMSQEEAKEPAGSEKTEAKQE